MKYSLMKASWNKSNNNYRTRSFTYKALAFVCFVFVTHEFSHILKDKHQEKCKQTCSGNFCCDHKIDQVEPGTPVVGTTSTINFSYNLHIQKGALAKCDLSIGYQSNIKHPSSLRAPPSLAIGNFG